MNERNEEYDEWLDTLTRNDDDPLAAWWYAVEQNTIRPEPELPTAAEVAETFAAAGRPDPFS